MVDQLIVMYRMDNNLEIILPYLKIVDDESIAESLRNLVAYDFKPGDNASFKLYKETYEHHIKKRETEELQRDYENLLQLQAEHFTNAQKGRQAKENFYKGLKHLSQKRSLKAFNDEVITKLKFAFEPDFHPSELLDEEMPEYRKWKELSKPFKFLATY